MKFMVNVLYIILRVDAACLNAGTKLVVWLCEWFSITRGMVERGLIALTLALALAADVFTCLYLVHPRGAEPRWATSFIWFAYLTAVAARFVFPWFLLREHRIDWERRLWRLTIWQISVGRCIGSVFLILVTLPILLPPLRAQDVFWFVEIVVYVIGCYITAMGGTGERGRRRKEAWSKVKQAFQVPVTRPA